MAINDEVSARIQEVLEMWDITYDKEDEKYVAKTHSYAVLNPEQIEWMRQLGLHIYSVQKFEDILTVRFAPGGWRR